MEPVDILTSRNLKRTSCREGIIKIIIASKNALSENEIREKLDGNYNRTTFYRSFKTLEENKVIHKIVVNNQLVKYALDNSITQKKEHAHFFCKKCNVIQCLDSVLIKKPKLPDGYSVTESEYIIKGFCKLCKENTDKDW